MDSVLVALSYSLLLALLFLTLTRPHPVASKYVPPCPACPASAIRGHCSGLTTPCSCESRQATPASVVLSSLMICLFATTLPRVVLCLAPCDRPRHGRCFFATVCVLPRPSCLIAAPRPVPSRPHPCRRSRLTSIVGHSWPSPVRPLSRLLLPPSGATRAAAPHLCRSCLAAPRPAGYRSRVASAGAVPEPASPPSPAQEPPMFHAASLRRTAFPSVCLAVVCSSAMSARCCRRGRGWSAAAGPPSPVRHALSARCRGVRRASHRAPQRHSRPRRPSRPLQLHRRPELLSSLAPLLRVLYF